MKVYSIGREVGCDIVINDSTDVISRRHAILNVTSSGKMTIVDQSHNGTYVNGIRISPNVPVPVTRKDNVSFAHVARLDWNMVPKTTSPAMYALMALAALVVIVVGFIGFNYFSSPGNEDVVAADSVSIKQKDIADAKATLKIKISEANGLKSAISDTEIADSLGKAIKTAQETYDDVTATKEKITSVADALQKAVDFAKAKQQQATKAKTSGEKSGKKSKKETESKQAKEVKKCGTCGEPLSECKYKGKHPAKQTSRSDR